MSAKSGEVLTLQGYAGTGKTYTTSLIIKNILLNGTPNINKKEAGKGKPRILVLTPTAAARTVIRNKIFDALDGVEGADRLMWQIHFKTVASLMKQHVSYVHINSVKFCLDHEEPVDGVLGTTAMRAFINTFKLLDVEPDILYTKKIRQQGALVEKVFVREAALKRAAKVKFKTDATTYTEDAFELLQPAVIADTLNQYNFITVDEAPMFSENEANTLVDAIEMLKEAQELPTAPPSTPDAPFLLITGDPQQLPPVNDIMNSYMLAKPDYEQIFALTEVVRSGDALTQLATIVKGKQPLNKLTFLPHVDSSNDASIHDLIHNNKDEFMKADVVLAHQNIIVDTLNNELRALHNFHMYDTPQPKEILMVTHNTGTDGLANGDTCIIEHVYDVNEVGVMLEEYHKFKPDDDTQFNAALLGEYNQHKATALAIATEKTFLLARVVLTNGRKTDAWIENPLHNRMQSYSLKKEHKIELNTFNDYISMPIPVVNAVFGYARTVHKSQGSEWENVVYVVPHSDWRPPQQVNTDYVGVSRARENLKVFYCMKINPKAIRNKS